MKINSETSHYRDVDFDSDIPEATIIPFPQKIKSEDQGAPPPEQTVDIGREDSAYHFDYDAINLHVKMLFELAAGIPGKFVVLALTGDKTDPPYEIAHFRADGGPNEVERMADTSTTGRSGHAWRTLRHPGSYYSLSAIRRRARFLPTPVACSFP